jgi:uncharacterized coiled-coil DUF342 family protein
MLWEKVKEIEEKLYEVRQEREKLEEEIGKLPDGHIDIKKIGNRNYYYLRYWEDGKLKSRYLGKDAKDIAAKVNLCNELKRKLVLVKDEEKRLEKAIEKIKNAIENS